MLLLFACVLCLRCWVVSSTQLKAYGVKVFDLLGEQGVASEGAMAIYAEFHAVVEELQKKLTEKQEAVAKIKEEEKTLFK